MAEERRKHPRIAVQGVFSYTCLDEKGQTLDEGMGTTVDISQGGILIETSRPIETAQILLVAIDSNREMLEIKGEVVHTRAVGPSKYLSGIKFIGSREEIMKMVKNFIIEHHSRNKPIR